MFDVTLFLAFIAGFIIMSYAMGASALDISAFAVGFIGGLIIFYVITEHNDDDFKFTHFEKTIVFLTCLYIALFIMFNLAPKTITLKPVVSLD